MVPVISGGAVGGGALIGGLVAVLLLWYYRKGCFANASTGVAIEVKPTRMATELPDLAEPLTPTDGRRRAHSRLDAMSAIAKSVAARAKGQRDIEMARLAAHVASVTTYASTVSTALPAVISPPVTATTTAPAAMAIDMASVSAHAEPNVAEGEVIMDDEEAGHAVKPPPSPVKRAGSMFVEKVGWMSSKSAKRLGKKGVKGVEAERMAALATAMADSGKGGGAHSNMLASTSL